MTTAAWSKICTPLEMGGLGFMSISELASCALRRQAWHIACRRKSIWVDWVYKKYIKEKSFWDLNYPSNCSWGWAEILLLRSKILPFVHHMIGDGKSTSFLLDPWLPCGRLIYKFGGRAVYDLGLGKDIAVSSFISNGSWRFPHPSSLQLIDIHKIILEAPLPSPSFSDEIIWNGTMMGLLPSKLKFIQFPLLWIGSALSGSKGGSISSLF